MNRDIEKYTGYYLSVYLVVLFFCGFFQYFAVCSGQSLECAFDMEGMNTIITTTAYVLTPIVAIIALLIWKTQHNRLTLAKEAKLFIKAIEKDVKRLAFLKSELKALDVNLNLHNQNQILEVIASFKKVQNNQNDITTISSLFHTLSNDKGIKIAAEKYQKQIAVIGLNIIQVDAKKITTSAFVNSTIFLIDQGVLTNKAMQTYLKKYVIID